MCCIVCDDDDDATPHRPLPPSTYKYDANAARAEQFRHYFPAGLPALGLNAPGGPNQGAPTRHGGQAGQGGAYGQDEDDEYGIDLADIHDNGNGGAGDTGRDGDGYGFGQNERTPGARVRPPQEPYGREERMRYVPGGGDHMYYGDGSPADGEYLARRFGARPGGFGRGAGRGQGNPYGEGDDEDDADLYDMGNGYGLRGGVGGEDHPDEGGDNEFGAPHGMPGGGRGRGMPGPGLGPRRPPGYFGGFNGRGRYPMMGTHGGYGEYYSAR
ncbi:hypothetical protein NA57DRAFT_70614 [Rhizodiscina lignyota]|uniref:Uncharacterized protein n=1 Tax=Rhizodiscina lignyota TaxID=1504668 RepID=A0A9P4IQS9_9PEZI|nr:hypothetical protein NA57DRAFT_70614 [Rhizodiscina lignyota]